MTETAQSWWVVSELLLIDEVDEEEASFAECLGSMEDKEILV